MAPEDRMRLVWLGVMILLVGVVGLALVLAMLLAWRNYNRRDRLVEQGRQLRARQRGEDTGSTYRDAWREAGQRYHDPAAPPQAPPDDEPEADDDDAPPRG